jgi:hypothetical protein
VTLRAATCGENGRLAGSQLLWCLNTHETLVAAGPAVWDLVVLARKRGSSAVHTRYTAMVLTQDRNGPWYCIGGRHLCTWRCRGAYITLNAVVAKGSDTPYFWATASSHECAGNEAQAVVLSTEEGNCAHSVVREGIASLNAVACEETQTRHGWSHSESSSGAQERSSGHGTLIGEHLCTWRCRELTLRRSML